MKLVAVLGAVVVSALAFVGCGEVECSVCGQTKSGDTYEVMGEEVDMCDDCHDALEKLGNALK